MWLTTLRNRLPNRKAKAPGHGRRTPCRPRLEALEDRLTPATVSWINSASGFWDVGSNWSNGVGPQAGDNVVINQPGNITVTFRTGIASINSLDTNSDSLALTGGTFTWMAGTWTGTINVGTGGTLSIAGPAGRTLAGVINNDGLATWSASR